MKKGRNAQKIARFNDLVRGCELGFFVYGYGYSIDRIDTDNLKCIQICRSFYGGNDFCI